MQQLRKNDGYVLPYVLVVFLVLSFVAVSICAGSINNLRAQETAITRTQDLYTVEGDVEQFLATAGQLPCEGTAPILDSDEDAEANALLDLETKFLEEIKKLEIDGLAVDENSQIDEVVIQAKNTDGSVVIDAVYAANLKYSYPDVVSNQVEVALKGVTWDCREYHISRFAGGGA